MNVVDMIFGSYDRLGNVALTLTAFDVSEKYQATKEQMVFFDV